MIRNKGIAVAVGLGLVLSSAVLSQTAAAYPECLGSDLHGVAHGNNVTGEPLGGGDGYTGLVNPPSVACAYPSTQGHGSCNFVSQTGAAFKDVVEKIAPGSTLYINDDLDIDLTGLSQIDIPANVTVASGRGRRASACPHCPPSKGAMLRTSSYGAPMIRLFNPGVRITGLRFHGPGLDENPGGLIKDAALKGRGIRIDTINVTIDNCDITQWNTQAIEFGEASSAVIRNNNIHHNPGGTSFGTNYGYGIVLYGTGIEADIRGNIFNANKHSVATNGEPDSAYAAIDNLILWNNVNPVFHLENPFDAHGHCERTDGAGYGSPWTTEFYLWNNTVLLGTEHVLWARGTPKWGAEVTDNAFATTDSSVVPGVPTDTGAPSPRLCSSSEPICFTRHTHGNGGPNSTDECHEVIKGWDGNQISAYASPYTAVPGIPQSPACTTSPCSGSGFYWSPSWDGNNPPPANAAWMIPAGSNNEFYYVGATPEDGNCQGIHRWLISRGATDDWKLLVNSSYEVADLGFGDFSGDGRTDVLSTPSGVWNVSADGMSGWSQLNSSNAGISSLRFGDFDNDGQTDIFTIGATAAGDWDVSWSGSTAWDKVGNSSANLADLRFGDFNGDGKTDIFRRSNNEWYVSFSTVPQGNHTPSVTTMTTWRLIKAFSGGSGVAPNGSGASLDHLRFADFTGDGATDVFFAKVTASESNQWYVWAGPKNCNTSTVSGCTKTYGWSSNGWNGSPLASSAALLTDLAIGNFNDDPYADVLHIHGGTANYSENTNRFEAVFSGMGSWQVLGQAPPFPLSQMAFHDFDDDGVDDVFVSHQD